MTNTGGRDRDDLNLREAFELARSTLSALVLINGGAAIGILTFYGNSMSVDVATKLSSGWIAFALYRFAAGVTFAVVASLLGYIIQSRWGQNVPKGVDLLSYDRRTMIVNWIAVAVSFGSVGCFSWAAWLRRRGFVCSSVWPHRESASGAFLVRRPGVNRSS